MRWDTALQYAGPVGKYDSQNRFQPLKVPSHPGEVHTSPNHRNGLWFGPTGRIESGSADVDRHEHKRKGGLFRAAPGALPVKDINTANVNPKTQVERPASGFKKSIHTRDFEVIDYALNNFDEIAVQHQLPIKAHSEINPDLGLRTVIHHFDGVTDAPGHRAGQAIGEFKGLYEWKIDADGKLLLVQTFFHWNKGGSSPAAPDHLRARMDYTIHSHLYDPRRPHSPFHGIDFFSGADYRAEALTRMESEDAKRPLQPNLLKHGPAKFMIRQAPNTERKDIESGEVKGGFSFHAVKRAEGAAPRSVRPYEGNPYSSEPFVNDPGKYGQDRNSLSPMEVYPPTLLPANRVAPAPEPPNPAITH